MYSELCAVGSGEAFLFWAFLCVATFPGGYIVVQWLANLFQEVVLSHSLVRSGEACLSGEQ